jgi:hypothetical protein
MKPLIPALLFLAVFQTLSSGATEEAKLSPADLLDQAIWWPGNFGQIANGDSKLGPSAVHHLQAYGTIIAQEFPLSENRMEQLRSRRDGIATELVVRLKAFDWNNFPEANTPTAEIMELFEAERSTIANEAGPGAWQPHNSKALGSTMLRVIEGLDAVETLPELLRLEDELNTLNEAVENMPWSEGRGFWNEPFPAVLPGIYIPPIEIGGLAIGNDSDGYSKSPEIEALYKPGKPGAALGARWLQWERKVFHNRIFQREILGVSLGLLERKEYKPLRHSLIGRLTALGRRREGWALLEEGGMRSEADFSPEQRRAGLIWDANLGVPRYSRAMTPVPWGESVRKEARRLVQGFIKNELVSGLTDGAALLEESIGSPGGWDQICAVGTPLPENIPMPAGATLVRRHFGLGYETFSRLQAHRDLVLPVLLERLRMMRLETQVRQKAERDDSFPPSRSGQDSRSFGPVLLEVVDCLNAVECLPDLLRMEQQLEEIIAKAGAEADAPLPDLTIDAPAVWRIAPEEDKSPDALQNAKRTEAMLVCKIYQRELLALIKTLLERETYAPIKSSVLVKAQLAEGRKELLKQVAMIQSEDDVQFFLTKAMTWDAEAKKARAKEGAVMLVQIPYTNAIREEIRDIAGRYLKEVPPEKRKAGDGMVLSWLENE